MVLNGGRLEGGSNTLAHIPLMCPELAFYIYIKSILLLFFLLFITEINVLKFHKVRHPAFDDHCLQDVDGHTVAPIISLTASNLLVEPC